MHFIQLQNRLKIIKITHKAEATHLGSALSAVDIIEGIYEVKKPKEKFILSAGHCASALYTVLENHGFLKNPNLHKLEYHPKRNKSLGIDLSTGSLGQGLPIAVGMALADRKKKVYCLISDGECMEGSICEAIRVMTENNLINLIVVVNANGYTAYKEADTNKLIKIFKGFGLKIRLVDGHNLKDLKKTLCSNNTKPTIIMAKTKVNQLPFLRGLSAHYYKMTKKDYQLAIKKWSKK
jgi:transketolase